MGVLAGLFFLIVGVVALAFPDAWWEWTRFNNQLEGKASERSDVWETGRIVAALACILLGVAAICLGFQQP